MKLSPNRIDFDMATPASFEWDEAKNQINIRKHNLDFSDAPEIFTGPMLTILDTRFDYDENRWIRKFGAPLLENPPWQTTTAGLSPGSEMPGKRESTTPD